MNFSGYDIIGDVHGCANTLEKLLDKLGYRLDSGVYHHQQRQAIFVGDILDRGPHIRETLHIVKKMVDAGTAQCVMGNHEFNILCYTTPIKDLESEETRFIRPHNVRNNRLVAETLTQFSPYPEEWRVFLDWFVTLPLFLEMPGFRVVHACWDEHYISQFKERYNGNQINKDYILACLDRKSFEFECVDRLTRGTDLKLPDDRVIRSKDGIERNFFRTKFWAHQPEFYKDVVFQPDPLPEDLLDQPLVERERGTLLSYAADQPPVFIGHYWLHGKPKPLRKNVACLDYSAVKYGRLAAYRYDGEAELRNEKFEWVYVDPS